MTEEHWNYINHLKHEFYSNTQWANCTDCIIACRHPLFSDLHVGFITGDKGKKMMYKYKNEPTVEI